MLKYKEEAIIQVESDEPSGSDSSQDSDRSTDDFGKKNKVEQYSQKVGLDRSASHLFEYSIIRTMHASDKDKKDLLRNLRSKISL